MKRIFEIEFDDDLGPLWMNRDNLLLCLTTDMHVGSNVELTVRDVTGDECSSDAATAKGSDGSPKYGQPGWWQS